jgi:chromosome segregation ATPase
MEISALEAELKSYQTQLAQRTNQLTELEKTKGQIIASANALAGAAQAIKILIDKANKAEPTPVAASPELVPAPVAASE